jgi:hypothetical protein
VVKGFVGTAILITAVSRSPYLSNELISVDICPCYHSPKPFPSSNIFARTEVCLHLLVATMQE